MKVFIIGGGAAGMFAAIFAKRSNAEVTLLERNEKLGKKLYITGKGRCNLTNTATDEQFFQNIVSNPKFLYAALKEWDSADTMGFFEKNRLPLKVERGGRVFPASDKSSDVIKTLAETIRKLGVKIHLNERVLSLSGNNGRIERIVTDKGEYSPDKVILATGGLSYPATGSCGDGWRIAEELGHTIIPPAPSLVGITLCGMFDVKNQVQSFSTLTKLQGISLKNVKASVRTKDSDKVLFEEFGEMLFTEKGVSGPIILTLSAKINRLPLHNLILSIDLKPALTEKMLDDRIIRMWQEEGNRQYKNSLSSLLPSGLISVIVALSGIVSEKPVHSVTKEERKSLVFLLKNWRFPIAALEPIERAVVTAGGISVKEIEPRTMRSKLYHNLYFAGEIIDIDALTGGYNIQLAFSTAHSAGTHIREE